MIALMHWSDAEGAAVFRKFPGYVVNVYTEHLSNDYLEWGHRAGENLFFEKSEHLSVFEILRKGGCSATLFVGGEAIPFKTEYFPSGNYGKEFCRGV